jgi:hypothetical protein
VIIWLASYPKSGNTLVRAMVSSYFFTKDGIYSSSLIKKIKQFPSINLFKKFGLDITNEEELIQNYVNVQNSFNIKDTIQFTKTHSYLFNFHNKYPFTNLQNSLGVVYIVRDPRNVVESLAKFNSISIEQSSTVMTEQLTIGTNDISRDMSKIYTGTWASNFNSWKTFKTHQKYLLIKYEDLVSKRELVFLKILKFIYNLNNSKFLVDQKKFTNVINTTDFEKLKKLETEEGFSEAREDKKTRKKIPFFDQGLKRDWRKTLDINIRKKLETSFKNEMIELGYL